MIQGKLYDLYYPYGIHYMWHDITCISLHMHGDIALNECECMVEKNQHCVWYLIRWAQSSGTKSNRVARLNNVVNKICVG